MINRSSWLGFLNSIENNKVGIIGGGVGVGADRYCRYIDTNLTHSLRKWNADAENLKASPLSESNRVKSVTLVEEMDE